MPDTYGEMIGEAILHPETRELNSARITCKLAVTNRTLCGCGAMLDCKHCVVYEIVQGEDERTLAVLCNDCAAQNRADIIAIAAKSPSKSRKIRLATWAGYETL